MSRARCGLPPIPISVFARALLALALLVGCSGAPSPRYVRGELLAQVDFSAAYQWEAYTNAAQRVDFRIEDGAYRARAWDGGFMWTLDSRLHTDAVIEVDTLLYSSYRDNSYGVMCRASPDNNSDGYYFFISADGYFTIRRGFNDIIQPLIEWTPSSAIAQDSAPNRLRVVCVGDALSLYVNGQVVAQTHDSLYTRGSVGLTAAVPEGGEVDVAFDNLRVWAAQPG